MFEIPEYITLSRQINQHLSGKVIRTGNLGNSLHKFVWHNRTEEDFARLVAGRTIGESFVRGRWMFIPLEPGYHLLFGECGGKMIYHKPDTEHPKKYHLCLEFEDGSFLTETTQMWGAMELHDRESVWERQYIKDMRPTPLDETFTFDYFTRLVDEACSEKKTSAKSLLTQDQLIPGLGNACAQDILFLARLHPRHDVAELDRDRLRQLYDAIQTTLAAIIEGGGRADEFDLFGEPGGYRRLMDKNAVGKPCPVCGTLIEKFAYLGGICYVCPSCQDQ